MEVIRTKEEILSKIFNSRWNYAWGRVDNHVISRFYTNGGFSGLYDFILSEKERMSKDKQFGFSDFYSSDLVETLKQAKELLTDADFRDYILNSNKVMFNKHNFLKLEEYGMLEFYKHFDSDFRGIIKSKHIIGDYCIIETYSHEKGSSNFYNKSDFTTCFDSLEQALIYKIYNGKYFDTLLILLNNCNI